MLLVAGWLLLDVIIHVLLVPRSARVLLVVAVVAVIWALRVLL